MPRTPRTRFPCVHSLYLSAAQDAELRRFVDKSGHTASEVMREALGRYLRDQDPAELRDDAREPTRGETRRTILERAAERRHARGPGVAPPLRGPGYELTTPLVLWQPPPLGWVEPEGSPYDRNPVPLAIDDQGEPFDPPANAYGWRVVHQVWRKGPLQPLRTPAGYEMVLPLATTHAQFLDAAIHHRPGAYHLFLVDDKSRVLRFSPVYIPLGDAVHWQDEGG
jgi:hypothetical protein